MARGTRIAGITIEIGGDTTKLQQALKGVDTQISKTQGALRDIDRLLKLDPTNTELLTQKQKDLKTAIENTKERLEKLKSAQSDSLTTEQWDSLQREIVDTEQKLKDLQKQYKTFGSVAGQQLKAVGKKIADNGKKITSVGKKLTRNLTVPLVAGFTIAATKYAEVDKIMQLTNKTMGNTAEESDTLNQAMKDAAANSIFGMTDAANATLNFARAGLNAEEAAAALAPAMNLAAGEGGNLDTVSAGLVATINGFHGSFDDAAHYADVFASACNNSALDVDSLSSAMSIAAPVFAAAGYSVEDAALYMGVMANNGIDANKAATSLKTGFARLVDPPKAAAEALKGLGFSITDANGEMKDSTTIQQELHDAFAGLSEAEQIAAASAIFGKNQFSPWLALINTAPEEVDGLTGSLSNCAGTTDEMSEAMMSGFGGSIEQLKSSLDVLMTSLGELLATYMLPVIQAVQSAVDWLNSLDESQKDLIIKIALVVAAIGPLVTGIGSAVTAFGNITTGVGQLINVFSTMDPKMKLVGLAVAAAAALIVANWDKIKEFWETKLKPAFEALKTFVVETVVPKVKAAWEDLKTKITEIFGKIKEVWEKKLKPAFEALKTFVTTTVVPKVKAAWGELQTKIDNVFGAIKELWEKVLKPLLDTMKQDFVDNILPVIIEAWESLQSTFESVFNGISTWWNQYGEGIIQGVVDFISGAVGGAMDVLTGLINFITGVFSGDWQKAWEGVKSAFGTIFNGIGNLLKTPINGIIEMINKMISKVETGINNVIRTVNNKVRIKLDPISVFGKQVFPGLDWGPNIKEAKFGRLKTLYTGGVLGEGERAMVGEYAPEYLTVRNGQAIVTPMPGADRFGNTNNEITVNIYTQPGQSARDIAREAIDIMTREQRQRSAAYA